MKKQLLVLSGLFMLFSVNQVQAQAITNGGFETWVSAPTYEVPVTAPTPVFGTSNDESFIQYGILTMTKINGVSGFALRCENKQAPNGDTLKSYVSFGQSDNGQFS